MKIVLSGFLVVGPATDGYRGIDREPWSDLHREHYAGKLPSRLASIRKNIYENGLDFSGIELTAEISVAVEVLNWMRTCGYAGEVIAADSPVLRIRKGSFWGEVNTFLGWDVFSLGDWSLIRAGIIDSNVMKHWRKKLNQHQLFSDDREIKEFIREYHHYALVNELEQLNGGEDFPVEPVKVWSVDA